MNTLQTARLLIRPLAIDDLNALYQLLDVDLHWAGPNISIAQRRERLLSQIALARWEVTGCIYGDRAIVLREHGQLIGICGFRPWMCTPAERGAFDLALTAQEHPLRTLELGVGYALSSQYRKQGYATEAVRALIEYAFRKLRVHRVVALAERGNLDSVRLMRRVGMTVGLNPDPDAAYPWAVGVIEDSGKTATDTRSTDNDRLPTTKD